MLYADLARFRYGAGLDPDREPEKQAMDTHAVDVVSNTSPESVWDLNRMPRPLPSDHFREVPACDVLDHLDNVIAVMEEIHRSCAPGPLSTSWSGG
ncbi:MAG: hypothetical protein ABSH31_23695 [Bryobacteraceae bacterium]|jgi:hypothetical protein